GPRAHAHLSAPAPRTPLRLLPARAPGPPASARTSAPGQVEAVNKMIKSNLKKKLEAKKGA
ncbi:hypothetical protein, partial [Escherichia coli]|uniref:hypothetical protein n=1 Tax=Escherichia coli TaxID=562 RepID=UPI001BE43D84